MIELTKRKKTTLSIAACLIILVAIYVGNRVVPPTSGMRMLFTVLEKGSIYALVAVSMNLLNGFTGLFSLGQAGFMLIGAYTYAIFSIPVGMRDSVYQYFDGGLIKFSVTETLGNALGGVMGDFGVMLGEHIGMIFLMLCAGLLTAGVAALIGLPVLRLKSDYLESFLPVESRRSYHKQLKPFEKLYKLRNTAFPDYCGRDLYRIYRSSDKFILRKSFQGHQR